MAKKRKTSSGPSFKLVTLIWVDITSQHGGWTPIELVEPTLSRVVTCGIVVHQDKETITLVTDITDFLDVNERTTIPKSNIEKLVDLGTWTLEERTAGNGTWVLVIQPGKR